MWERPKSRDQDLRVPVQDQDWRTWDQKSKLFSTNTKTDDANC